LLLGGVGLVALVASLGLMQGLSLIRAGTSLDAPSRTADASFGTVSIEQVLARSDQQVQVRVSLTNRADQPIEIRPSMFRLIATGSDQTIPAQPAVWLLDASVSPHEGRTVSVNFVVPPGQQPARIEIDDPGRPPVVLAANESTGASHG
jgi:uncharacterized protein DUF4352